MPQSAMRVSQVSASQITLCVSVHVPIAIRGARIVVSFAPPVRVSDSAIGEITAYSSARGRRSGEPGRDTSPRRARVSAGTRRSSSTLKRALRSSSTGHRGCVHVPMQTLQNRPPALPAWHRLCPLRVCSLPLLSERDARGDRGAPPAAAPSHAPRDRRSDEPPGPSAWRDDDALTRPHRRDRTLAAADDPQAARAQGGRRIPRRPGTERPNLSRVGRLRSVSRGPRSRSRVGGRRCVPVAGALHHRAPRGL